jgi:serine phosphatase RsbU (regulator of sigma subunit)
MLYGEIRPFGKFRFVNFGHVPPLVFSAEYQKFMDIDKSRMVQFLPLGVHIPEDHPDRKRYLSLDSREGDVNGSDVAELTLLSPGDIFVLYTDGVYDGSDKEERQKLEGVMREHYRQPVKEICNALLDYAVKRDDRLRQMGEEDRIDDKTVLIIKRN